MTGRGVQAPRLGSAGEMFSLSTVRRQCCEDFGRKGGGGEVEGESLRQLFGFSRWHQMHQRAERAHQTPSDERPLWDFANAPLLCTVRFKVPR